MVLGQHPVRAALPGAAFPIPIPETPPSRSLGWRTLVGEGGRDSQREQPGSARGNRLCPLLALPTARKKRGFGVIPACAWFSQPLGSRNPKSFWFSPERLWRDEIPLIPLGIRGGEGLKFMTSPRFPLFLGFEVEPTPEFQPGCSKPWNSSHGAPPGTGRAAIPCPGSRWILVPLLPAWSPSPFQEHGSG